jgi:hypothetical protein
MNRVLAFRSMATLVVTLAAAFALTGATPALAQRGGPATAPAPQVTVLATTGNAGFRVAAPTQTSLGARSATITVSYTGFTAEAQASFQAAVDVWAALVTSPVTIHVQATMSTLAEGVLGSAGSAISIRDFGAGTAGTWYPIPLANKLKGSDLCTSAVPCNGVSHDINASFTNTLPSGFSWYYGTDGNAASNQYDFMTVVLHELGHGLGFTGSFGYTSPNGRWGLGTGFPFIFDRFVVNGSDQSLINTGLFANPSSALGTQLLSDNVYFTGTEANAANGGSKPRLYAPTSWNGGSSIYHLNDATFNGTAHALMTHALSNGESVHAPGEIVLAMFRDMGWSTDTPVTEPPDAPSNVRIGTTNGTSIQVLWNDNASDESYNEVVRSPVGLASYTTVNVAGANGTSWTHSGLSGAVAFNYWARACNSAGCSALVGGVIGATAAGATPTAPSNVHVGTVTNTTIQVLWNENASTEAYYQVVWSPQATPSYIYVPLVPNTASWTHSGLSAGQAYYYWVRACNGAGCTAWAGGIMGITSGGAVPAAPTNVGIGGITSTSITVNWNDVSNNETNFQVVYTKSSPINYITQSLAASTTTWNHSGLTTGDTYYYWVRACNGVLCSGYSGGVAGTAAATPAAPTGLQVSSVTSATINLQWNDNATGESSYQVVWSAVGSSSYTYVNLAANATTWGHTGLGPSQSFYYWVRACNGTTCSAFAGAVTGTTSGSGLRIGGSRAGAVTPPAGEPPPPPDSGAPPAPPSDQPPGRVPPPPVDTPPATPRERGR